MTGTEIIMNNAVTDWKSLVTGDEKISYLDAAIEVTKIHDVSMTNLYDELVARGLIIHW